jgi:hypothetical protein
LRRHHQHLIGAPPHSDQHYRSSRSSATPSCNLNAHRRKLQRIALPLVSPVAPPDGASLRVKGAHQGTPIPPAVVWQPGTAATADTGGGSGRGRGSLGDFFRVSVGGLRNRTCVRSGRSVCVDLANIAHFFGTIIFLILIFSFVHMHSWPTRRSLVIFSFSTILPHVNSDHHACTHTCPFLFL